MKLFKKLMVALSVLLVIGMLAACSDGNKDDGDDANTKTNTVNDGGNSSNNTSDGYKIVYNGKILVSEDGEDEDEPMSWEEAQAMIKAMKLEETTDYTVNHTTKTITLTKSGYDKGEAMEKAMENAMSQLGDDDDIDLSSVYTVKYNGKTVTTVPEALLPMYALMLEEDTDYTIDESTKTITLTDAGYEKMSGDDEDDED